MKPYIILLVLLLHFPLGAKRTRKMMGVCEYLFRFENLSPMSNAYKSWNALLSDIISLSIFCKSRTPLLITATMDDGLVHSLSVTQGEKNESH